MGVGAPSCQRSSNRTSSVRIEGVLVLLTCAIDVSTLEAHAMQGTIVSILDTSIEVAFDEPFLAGDNLGGRYDITSGAFVMHL